LDDGDQFAGAALLVVVPPAFVDPAGEGLGVGGRDAGVGPFAAAEIIDSLAGADLKVDEILLLAAGQIATQGMGGVEQTGHAHPAEGAGDQRSLGQALRGARLAEDPPDVGLVRTDQVADHLGILDVAELGRDAPAVHAGIGLDLIYGRRRAVLPRGRGHGRRRRRTGLIIGRPLRWVRKNAISLVDRLKGRRRVLASVQVWVQSLGHGPVGLLDGFLGRRGGDPENAIIPPRIGAHLSGGYNGQPR